VKTRPADWFDDEHAKLLWEGRVWGTAAMYVAKIDCLAWSLRSAGLGKEARILDVGCGTGELADRLREAGYTRVDGVDISSVAIAHAASAGVGKFRSVDFATPVHLGIQYDCIFDADCLHMVVKRGARKAFLRNVKSHLRTGGIFVTGINSSKPGISPFVEVDGVVQYYWPTKSDFAAEMSSGGFTAVAQRDLPARNQAHCELWCEMVFSTGDPAATPRTPRRKSP
jgi:SAM-dependent methyltransferase